MEKYIFKKSKGKYIWQGPELKLVFSGMTFQAHDDCGYVSSTEDFLYLYYTVQIYVHERVYDKNGKATRRWKLVTSKSTYDFPSITILQEILQHYVDDDIPEEDCGVIHYYDDGEIMEFLSQETYSVDTAGRIVKIANGKVTEMFLENDIVDSIHVYFGDLNSDSFYSESYHHVKISAITENGITITGGYCQRDRDDYNEEDVENRKLFISCKNIFYVFSDITEQVLALDEQGIADEFRTVLTGEELAEIKNSNVEEMYQKWYEVIVDRYIIFRDEHPFRKIKKDSRKNAMEAVRTVIKILRA